MILPQKNPAIKDITYLVDGSTVSRTKGGAFSFGYIPSGGTSKTIIVYLGVSGVVRINNIKIYLKSTGGINFSDATFGVDTLDYINPDFVPSQSFEGVNSTDNPNSAYSFSVENRNSLSSKYVYLNVSFPSDKSLVETVVAYGWTFEYEADKTLSNQEQIA